jgi:hypothetical protein
MQRRALIVDDDPAVCGFIKGILAASGVEALTLTSGLEAQAYLRKEKFTVAVFDLRMRAPDGAELARQAPAFFCISPIDKARLLKLLRAPRRERLSTNGGAFSGSRCDRECNSVSNSKNGKAKRLT